ncbi:MAG: hypothetical protein ACM3SY_01155 [Candidatus Omnitrophota bacterium]
MIVFRTDASQKTGFGHLNRSTYLASLLKSKSEVLFCMSDSAMKDKAVSRFLGEKKFSRCSVKDLEQPKGPEYQSVVFDLREFSPEDLRLLHLAQKNGKKTVQITDLGLSQQAVDVTIDGSIVNLFPYRDEKKNHLLAGPDYTILHTRYRHFHGTVRKYRQRIRKVFICFGGGATYRDLREAIDQLTRHHLEVKIAPGYYLKKNSPKTLRRIYSGIRFVGNVSSLARAFFEADVALITAGIAAYEAAAVGTPALYFHYNEEQKAIAQAFETKGAGLEIAKIADLIHVDLAEKMNTLTFSKRVAMGNCGKEWVDARGVYRIIDFFQRTGIIAGITE